MRRSSPSRWHSMTVCTFVTHTYCRSRSSTQPMMVSTASSSEIALIPTPSTSTRPGWTATSVRTATSQHGAGGLPQDHEVNSRRPVLHVVEVEAHGLFPRQIRATADLPKTGHARPHEQAPPHIVPGLLDTGRQRARADKRHLTEQHVHQLRKLVEGVAPQEPAHRCHPIIDGVFREHATRLVAIRRNQCIECVICALPHRAELVNREERTATARPLLPEHRPAGARGADRDRSCEQQRRRYHEQHQCCHAIECRLRELLPAVQLWFFHVQKRKTVHWPHPDPRTCNVGQCGRHEQIDTAALEVPGELP